MKRRTLHRGQRTCGRDIYLCHEPMITQSTRGGFVHKLQDFRKIKHRWHYLWNILRMSEASVVDPEGVQGVRFTNSPSTLFKYTMKVKLFGLSETKLFHFHGIFKTNEIQSTKRTPTSLYIWTPFLETLDPPLGMCCKLTSCLHHTQCIINRIGDHVICHRLE